MIEKQSGGNCVARGLSTMRLALGYDTPTPGEYDRDKMKRVRHIIQVVGGWFPKHGVVVMCSRDNADGVRFDENVTYYGDYIPDFFDFDSHIVGFSYYVGPSTSESHFVIGVPTLYDGMKTSLCICVKMQEVTR